MPNPEQKPVEVIQADRDAAEAYLQTPVEMFGEHPLAVAFARHRINHAAPRLSGDLVERLRARVAVNALGQGTAFSDPLSQEAAGRIESDAALIRRLVEAAEKALPVIEEEHEVMVSSHTNISGPDVGEISGEAKDIVDRMDAAIQACRSALAAAKQGEERS